MNTYGLKNRSQVQMPGSGDETAPNYVEVKHIDAELIIAMEQRQQNLVTATTDSDSFQSPAWDYRVGPADVLSIVVWEHPELTIPAGPERDVEQSGTLVGADGTIFYPYAGVVDVAGKTLSEIRSILTERLGEYIEEVKLDVRVAEFNHKRVYVVGEVAQPQIVSINNIRPTLIEMINRAGGFTQEADSTQITLTRDNATYRIDLLALYENGDSSQNIPIEPGDVINVRDRTFNKIFVLGEVMTPGSYLMNKRRKTLAEALGDAGGVNETTANPRQVFVVRSDGDKPKIFHLDARSPDALILADRFALQPRDVVYVDAAKIVRWNRVIANVSGTLSTLNSASATDFPLFQGGEL